MPPLENRSTRLALAVLAATAASALGATPAAAARCVAPSAYPGGDAPREKVAAWMATGAGARGLPGELPVMAALVESGLRNLAYGDRDSLGYFQMRQSIWDTGEYAGYPDNPPLQLEWFVDHAIRQRPADPDDPAGWGEWIANVERPARQYRGRYQLRLGEARSLIAAGCERYAEGAAPPPGATPAPPTDVDRDPPAVRLTSLLSQPAVARRALVVSVACPAEACTARARALVGVPGAGVHRVTATAAAQLAAGARSRIELRLGQRLRRALAAALRRGHRPRARVIVTAVDGAGNRASASRAVRIV